MIRYIIPLLALLLITCDKPERIWSNPNDPDSERDSWKPSNLMIEQLSFKHVKISWEDVSRGEEGFIIDKKIENGDYQINYSIVGENVEEWIDTTSTPNKEIAYRLYAYYEQNESAYLEATITPVVSVPTNIIIENSSYRDVHIDWTYNTGFETDFSIERKTGNGEWELIGTTSKSTTFFIDSTFSYNTQNYYRIIAYDFYGDKSDYSSESNIIIHSITVPSDNSTIQGAINTSSDGYYILVEPGTYYENINFGGKNIVVGSKFMSTGDTSFISQTVIDGNQNSSVVSFLSGENITDELIGFTIQNGTGTPDYFGGDNEYFSGGGILVSNSSPTIKNCVIKNNEVNAHGGGILCYWGASPSFYNCVVSQNSAGSKGGGIMIQGNSAYTTEPEFYNVLIINNVAGNGSGIAGYGDGAVPYFENVTIGANTGSSTGVYYCNSIYYYFRNSIIADSHSNSGCGSGSLSHTYTNEGSPDPIFVDPDNNDFHLQSSSPCIDAGDPDPQYNDPDGSRNDMGAYGGKNGDW